MSIYTYILVVTTLVYLASEVLQRLIVFFVLYLYVSRSLKNNSDLNLVELNLQHLQQ